MSESELKAVKSLLSWSKKHESSLPPIVQNKMNNVWEQIQNILEQEKAKELVMSILHHSKNLKSDL